MYSLARILPITDSPKALAERKNCPAGTKSRQKFVDKVQNCLFANLPEDCFSVGLAKQSGENMKLILILLSMAFLIQPLIANEEAEPDESIVALKENDSNIVPLDRPGVVSLALQGADVGTVMKGISQLGNYDFVVKGEVAKVVNLTLNGRSIREALNIISDSTNTEYRIEGSIITVFGEDVDSTYTKTYTVQKGNTLTIANVLRDLVGGNLTSQTDGTTGGGAAPAPAASAGGDSPPRLAVDKLNGQIIVTAKPSEHRKIENVWEVVDVDRPKRRFQTKIFELKFISPTTFVSSIKFLIPGIEDSQIFSFADGGGSGGGGGEGGGAGGGNTLSSSQKRVIIQDTTSNLQRIDELLKEIDIPPRQVVIDLKMVEFTLNNDQKLGVDWKTIFTESGRAIPVGEFFSPFSSDGTARLKFGSLGPDHLQIILDFIQANSTAKILSNPQITVVDGQSATLTVGDQIPYRTTTTNQGVTEGTVNFATAGVELSVTPVIFKDDFVNLQLKPSITSRTGDFDGVPIISTKETETTLNIRNNHTVIMGGLISQTRTHEKNMVPILGAVPGLGKLFQSNSNNQRVSELVFLITPKIYSEFANHPHKYLKHEFRSVEHPKPGPYHFVDENQQDYELSEYLKRSKL